MFATSSKYIVPLDQDENVILNLINQYYNKFDPAGAAFQHALYLHDYMTVWNTYMRDHTDGVMGAWNPIKPFQIELVAAPEHFSSEDSFQSSGIRYRAEWIITMFPTWLHELNHAWQFMPHKSQATMMKEVGGTVTDDMRRGVVGKTVDTVFTIIRSGLWVLNRLVTLVADRVPGWKKTTIEHDSRVNTNERDRVEEFVEKLAGAFAGHIWLRQQRGSALLHPESEAADETRFAEAEREYIRQYGNDIWEYAGDLLKKLQILYLQNKSR